MKKRWIAMLTLCAVLMGCPAQPAEAQLLVYDPLNWVVKYADALKRLEEMIQRSRQINNQLKMLVRWGRQLSSFDLERLLRAGISLLQQYRQLIETLEELAEENPTVLHSEERIEQDLDVVFPGYEGPSRFDQWSESEVLWTERVLGTYKTAVVAAAESSELGEQRVLSLAELGVLSGEAQGPLEAAQVTHGYLEGQTEEMLRHSEILHLLLSVVSATAADPLSRVSQARRTFEEWIHDEMPEETVPLQGGTIR